MAVITLEEYSHYDEHEGEVVVTCPVCGRRIWTAFSWPDKCNDCGKFYWASVTWGVIVLADEPRIVEAQRDFITGESKLS